MCLQTRKDGPSEERPQAGRSAEQEQIVERAAAARHAEAQMVLAAAAQEVDRKRELLHKEYDGIVDTDIIDGLLSDQANDFLEVRAMLKRMKRSFMVCAGASVWMCSVLCGGSVPWVAEGTLRCGAGQVAAPQHISGYQPAICSLSSLAHGPVITSVFEWSELAKQTCKICVGDRQEHPCQ
jgi:hypothetical protein